MERSDLNNMLDERINNGDFYDTGESKLIEQREYQIEAWKNLRLATVKRLKQTLIGEQDSDVLFESSHPVYMATGTGKTAVIGLHIKNIFNLRDKIDPGYKINTLVLGDKIEVINQLKKFLIDGKDNKYPYLGKDISNNAEIKILHSKIHKSDILKNRLKASSPKDKIHFVTFDSGLKLLEDNDIGYDIILVDEAHHLSAEGYKEILQVFIDNSTKHKCRPPFFIPTTATPQYIRHLMNEPIFNYSLVSYMASEYAPKISYNFIHNKEFTSEQLVHLGSKLDGIKSIVDIKEKIRELRRIKGYIEKYLSSFDSYTSLCKKILSSTEINHGLIFVNSIKESEIISSELNKIGGTTTAHAIHCKMKESVTSVLDKYKKGEIKFLVAIDMLNESVDLPIIERLILLSNTTSIIKSAQQLGRGMRGQKEKILTVDDYTGNFINLSQVYDVNYGLQQYYNNKSTHSVNNNTEKKDERKRYIDIFFRDANNHMEQVVPINYILSDIETTYRKIDRLDESGVLHVSGKQYRPRRYRTDIGDKDWRIIQRKIEGKGMTKQALKENGNVILVYETVSINKVIEQKGTILSRLGDNGKTTISNKVYVWAGDNTPPENFGGISRPKLRTELKKKLKDPERKNQYVREARSVSGVVDVYEENVFGEILEHIKTKEKGRIIENTDYKRKKFYKDGDCIEVDIIDINGKDFVKLTQDIDYVGVKGQTARKKVELYFTNNPKNAEAYRIKARYENSTKPFNLYEKTKLDEILKEDIAVAQLPILNKQGEVNIDGKDYVYLSSRVKDSLMAILGSPNIKKVRSNSMNLAVFAGLKDEVTKLLEQNKGN